MALYARKSVEKNKKRNAAKATVGSTIASVIYRAASRPRCSRLAARGSRLFAAPHFHVMLTVTLVLLSSIRSSPQISEEKKEAAGSLLRTLRLTIFGCSRGVGEPQKNDHVDGTFQDHGLGFQRDFPQKPSVLLGFTSRKR